MPGSKLEIRCETRSTNGMETTWSRRECPSTWASRFSFRFRSCSANCSSTESSHPLPYRYTLNLSYWKQVWAQYNFWLLGKGHTYCMYIGHNQAHHASSMRAVVVLIFKWICTNKAIVTLNNTYIPVFRNKTKKHRWPEVIRRTAISGAQFEIGQLFERRGIRAVRLLLRRRRFTVTAIAPSSIGSSAELSCQIPSGTIWLRRGCCIHGRLIVRW